ncbi:glycosyltransferase family 4 protein [Hydrogenobacter hydrogenophilus]|uniref:Glycosyltransferase involved in cell wall bisynthesis n=1 Tax=Hydrogenobacter hydrogenophilus TaxID=35835 RepID=A0A285NPU0_9AQUI|nr:glycosyltransferase family 4 protein [Hydrogenobacter hydrogenophilus]SNZ11550.1 Glycosyltransferase involved in cell wall bisynthesis [Hydrogenobacter hydrogenophilus]
MNVLIVENHVPFMEGGAERHAENLKKALTQMGHTVEILRIPFKSYPIENLIKQAFIARIMDLEEVTGRKVDLLITMRFPNYYIDHPNKVVWLIHPYKGAHELWDRPYLDLPRNPSGYAVREFILQMDRKHLKNAKKLFVVSKTMNERIKKYLGLEGEVLYHPPPNTENLHCKEYQNFIFFPSRISPLKRHYLAIEAMKYVRSNIKLVVCGRPDSPWILEEFLQRLRGLEDRVVYLGEVSDEEKIDLYSRCLAVLFPTAEEDYGYVALEAMFSKKAVITCIDSGGPTEFIEDGITGFVVQPTPTDIAQAIDRLAQNPQMAMQMGERAYQKVLSMNLSWKQVVEKILEEL